MRMREKERERHRVNIITLCALFCVDFYECFLPLLPFVHVSLFCIPIRECYAFFFRIVSVLFELCCVANRGCAREVVFLVFFFKQIWPIITTTWYAKKGFYFHSRSWFKNEPLIIWNAQYQAVYFLFAISMDCLNPLREKSIKLFKIRIKSSK